MATRLGDFDFDLERDDLLGDLDLVGDEDLGSLWRLLSLLAAPWGSNLDGRVAAVTEGNFFTGDLDLDLDLSLNFFKRALLFSGGLSGGDASRYASMSFMSQLRVSASPGAREYRSRSS